jgi:folate-binding protein YgfZ
MSSIDQYAAARRSAVVFDRSAEGKIVFTGSDRRSFLHGLLTNDIVNLTNGTGVYAAYLTPQGRMVSDMRVIETGDQLLLAVDGSIAPALSARFEKLIFSEDVQVRDATGELDQMGVHGPAAAAAIGQVTGISVAALANQYDNVSSPRLTTIVRDDAFGVPGFDIYVERGEGTVLRSKLEAAGVASAGDDVYETLRVEAGRPRFGIDMTTDTIPLEAGIEDRAINFAKGCYVGQEVIVRVRHRGHGRVARRLVRLVLPNAAVPSRGDRIFAGARDVGEITSAVRLPNTGDAMALGYVHRDYASPDAELSVNSSQARVYQPID